MQVLHTLTELAALPSPINVAIGVFDGVHLGHQQVIAAACTGTSVVLTFDPHPRRILHPEKAPPLLTSTPHKLALIEQLGVANTIVLPFTRELADTPPESFLEQLAAPAHHVQQICVGTRFHFGHDRAGNARLMRQHAARSGYSVAEIPAVHTDDGEIISSSAVRQHVLHGHLERAAAMLGRPFSLFGTVEPGDRRGRTLGFPTANLTHHHGVLPPGGVYAARVGTRLAVVNIGHRPTFGRSIAGCLVEVHILDFNGDLYGHDMEVELICKLREEKTFPSIESLQAQICIDIERVRELLT